MATVKGSGINIPIRWIERGCPQSWMLKSSRWQLREGIDAFSRYNFLLFSFQNFFSIEVMLFKAIFIHLFSHFLDHEINLRYFPNQKCHDSNHENSCNDSSKGFLRHKLLSDIVWTIIWTQINFQLLLFWTNGSTLRMWNLISTPIRLPKKIKSSCTPRVCYKEIFTDWITKESKPYYIKKTWNSSGSGDERCE